MKKYNLTVPISVCFALTFSVGCAFAKQQTDTASVASQTQARADQIEAALNQNEGNVLSGTSDHLADNWQNRVTVTGQLNIDGKWRTTHGPSGAIFGPRSVATPSLFQSGYYNDIYLNNSQLDIDAYVNSWTTTHISLTGRDSRLVGYRYRTDVADNAPVNLDEAYVTIGNLNKSPLYTTIGRQYIPFGVYDRHPIEPTLTQYLTQTQATAAKLGFASSGGGVYGSLYAFRGQTFQSDSIRFSNFHHNVNNFGGQLGARGTSEVKTMPLDYQLSVGYLEDLGDVDWIADPVAGGILGGDTGAHDVPAISVDGKVRTGEFVWHGSYVQALSRFQTDLAASAVLPGTDTLLRLLNNARPWAFVFSGDYNFSVMGHDSTFSLNYQQSGDLDALGLPRIRFGGSYSLALLKDTHLTFDIFQDYNSEEPIEDYTHSAATQADLRLSVDF